MTDTDGASGQRGSNSGGAACHGRSGPRLNEGLKRESILSVAAHWLFSVPCQGLSKPSGFVLGPPCVGLLRRAVPVCTFLPFFGSGAKTETTYTAASQPGVAVIHVFHQTPLPETENCAFRRPSSRWVKAISWRRRERDDVSQEPACRAREEGT